MRDGMIRKGHPGLIDINGLVADCMALNISDLSFEEHG
jgi:hypothetical protein